MMPELLRDSTDGAESSSAHISQTAVGLGSAALREAGIADPSAETEAQAAQLLAFLGRAAVSAPATGSTLGRAAALAAAMFMAIVLFAVGAAGVWMFDQRVAIIEQQLDDVALVKARQDALVLHLLASVEQIAEAQGVKLPRPPAVLRIAEAQAAQAASQ